MLGRPNEPLAHNEFYDRTRKGARAIRAVSQSPPPLHPAWLPWLPLFFKWRDLLTFAFFYEQLEIAALPDRLRITFLGMRARIEAGRPIAEIGRAG